MLVLGIHGVGDCVCDQGGVGFGQMSAARLRDRGLLGFWGFALEVWVYFSFVM